MPSLSITRAGVFVPVRPEEGGAGPTPQQVRGKAWRRTGPGRYVPTWVDGEDRDQRIVEAAASLPDDAAVTGWAALGWMGGRWFSGLAPDGRTRLPVPVALGDQRTISPRPGVRLSEDWLFDGDVTSHDGLPVTIPLRSVTYQARRARTLLRAVQVLDMAAADDLVSVEEVEGYADRLPGRGGIRLLRAALPVADENAWSPQEVAMRLAWTHDAGRPRPLCNVPVFDVDGNHLFTPDLFDPEAGVAGEYDGAIHLESGTRRRDLNREAAYRDHRIEVATMMSADRRDTTDFLRRLEAAYRRATSRRSSGSWTLDQPGWWVDTSTVARRRALTDAERDVWLRRRAA